MLGQRRAGSFSSIRMTPALRLGGQSGRSSATGRGRSLKWAYITAMVDSPRNGSRPVSISYATTPSEYWSDAPVTSRVAHCSGLMRSEEHTSELQSRLHLVCRLLLEKK